MKTKVLLLLFSVAVVAHNDYDCKVAAKGYIGHGHSKQFEIHSVNYKHEPSTVEAEIIPPHYVGPTVAGLVLVVCPASANMTIVYTARESIGNAAVLRVILDPNNDIGIPVDIYGSALLEVWETLPSGIIPFVLK